VFAADPFPSRLLVPRRATLQACRGCSPAACQVCTPPLPILAGQSPCSFWLNRAPWPPSLLRQAPTHAAPRALPPSFAAVAAPVGEPLSSRLPKRVVGLSANHAVAAPRRSSGMHATPARTVSSRTSWPPASPAPGSLRLCAWVDGPFGGSYPASRLASLSSSRIPSRLGPLYGCAVVALHRAEVCTQPLSFAAGQSPLAAFPPAPGSHSKSTGFPVFPRG